MLATPVILAAGVLEIPTLFTIHYAQAFMYATIGAVISGIAAYFAVKFLMKYFKTGTLKPYAYYCIAAGVLALIILR